MKIKRIRFFASEYASYRDWIITFFIDQVLKRNIRIFDPMAGHCLLLPFIQKTAAIAYFNDIMPYHYYVNKAKTYAVFAALERAEKKKHNYILNEALHCLSRLRNKKFIVSEAWINDEILENLLTAWNRVNDYNGPIRDLLRAIIILCVRPLSTYTPCRRNGTWLKIGGVSTGESLSQIVKNNIEKFQRYFDMHYSGYDKSDMGKCYFSQEDSTVVSLNTKVDVVFTSPPYCNRFDPTKTYAPELFFLKRINGQSVDELVFGTPRVKGYIELEADLEYIKLVSPETRKFIGCVQSTQKKKETDYYPKCFTKYYAKLFRTFENIMNLVKKQGRIYVNVQNNIHRGNLNDIGAFIIDFFNNHNWNAQVSVRLLHGHQGTRNISEDYPVVVKKHWEQIIEAWR